MRYFPINIDIKGRAVVVVGGGQVARRKVMTLLKAGARVRLISPEATAELKETAAIGYISWVKRKYRAGDLEGAALVFVSADEETGELVVAEAEERGVPVNFADIPSRCTFTLPSIVERGDLMLTVSTGGKCPALAKHMRQYLEQLIDESYGELLEILGDVRQKLLTAGVGSDRCTALLNSLITSEVTGLIRDGEAEKVRGMACDMISTLVGCKVSIAREYGGKI